MKIKVLLFIIFLFFSSCTPYYINAIKNLDKESFEPLCLTPAVEANNLRIDIIRNTYTKTENDSVQRTEDVDYHPLGFYLGNGLFYDLNENLCLRVDSLLGVAENFKIEMISRPEKNKGIVVYTFENDSLIKTYPPRKKSHYIYHREGTADSVSYKYKQRHRFSIVKNDSSLRYSGKRKFYRGIYTLDEGLYCLNYKRKRELYELNKNQITLENDYVIRMLNNNTTIQIQRKGRKKSSTLYTIEKNDHEIYIYSNRYYAKKIVLNEDNILIYKGKVLWKQYTYEK